MNRLNYKNLNQHKRICRTSLLLSGVLFWLFGLTAIPVLADSPQWIPMQPTQVHTIQNVTTHSRLQDQAKLWGLTTEAFKRYLELMQNTPNGHWYKQLDPAEVLALNAKDLNQMRQYAKIQARNMHARVTRELAFNRMYSKAYKALYPNEKPIMSRDFPVGQGINLQSGDRVWLFVGIHKPLGRFAYQHLIKTVRATPNTVLDIYFVDKHLSQKAIQQWASHMGIAPDIVNQQVTLNDGNDRFENISKGEKVNLPFVGIVHNSHFQPITLSSVL